MRGERHTLDLMLAGERGIAEPDDIQSLDLLRDHDVGLAAVIIDDAGGFVFLVIAVNEAGIGVVAAGIGYNLPGILRVLGSGADRTYGEHRQRGKQSASGAQDLLFHTEISFYKVSASRMLF